jgi:hypothetical protein
LRIACTEEEIEEASEGETGDEIEGEGGRDGEEEAEGNRYSSSTSNNRCSAKCFLQPQAALSYFCSLVTSSKKKIEEAS